MAEFEWYLNEQTLDLSGYSDYFLYKLTKFLIPGYFTTKILSKIGNTDFDIKWVDDTHCLGVFASTSVASTVLSKNANPFLKTRPLSKATAESKRRAQRIVSFLKPYKPRPQTTSFVASRLIGASLGLNGLIPKDKLKEERKKIDNARDSKRKDREIKDAVWNGK